MYKIFPSRFENLVDAFGINRVLSFRADRYREFWAVRDVDLELRHGSRVGVIGRNGAGKSTLLKMITGGVAPTEGAIEVNGQVQALLDAGAGLHPEFTGRENLRAALTYQGLSSREITSAEKEILEFTELGDFLDQPFRTYSLGMQTRLGFAIATAVRPEILIVDEVLGAGDAYFFAKSTARMMDLVEGGASVLLVSHSLQQVTRSVDETIWMDRGRVVMRANGGSGQGLRQVHPCPRRSAVAGLDREYLGRPAESGRARELRRSDTGGASQLRTGQRLSSMSRKCASTSMMNLRTVSRLVGLRMLTLFTAHLMLNDGQWEPRREDGKPFRSLVRKVDSEIASTIGHLLFRLWFFYPQARYEVEVTYRLRGSAAQVGVGRERLPTRSPHCPQPSTGAPSGFPCCRHPSIVRRTTSRRSNSMSAGGPAEPASRSTVSGHRQPRRRPGDFALGDSLAVELDIRVEDAGEQPLILAALIFRDDGVVVTRHVSDKTIVVLFSGGAPPGLPGTRRSPSRQWDVSAVGRGCIRTRSERRRSV